MLASQRMHHWLLQMDYVQYVAICAQLKHPFTLIRDDSSLGPIRAVKVAHKELILCYLLLPTTGCYSSCRGLDGDMWSESDAKCGYGLRYPIPQTL
jgi:hypothetical protein